MMALTHQHIVRKINSRKARAAESELIEYLEHISKPLFYIVFFAAAAVCVWLTITMR